MLSNQVQTYCLEHSVSYVDISYHHVFFAQYIDKNFTLKELCAWPFAHPT